MIHKKVSICLLLILVLAACDPAPPSNPASLLPTQTAPTTVPPTNPPSQPTTTPEVPPPVIDPEFWQRVDGSTATIPLSEEIIAFLHGADAYAILQSFNHTTTPYAYENLLNGDADLIFVTYPSEEELAEFAAAGVEIQLIPVVKDALVMLVNVDNPVSGLTAAQLRDIYSGKITNWQEVGGPDREILAFQRTPNSGSQTLFLKLLMAGVEPMAAPSEWIVAGMAGLVDAVSSYDNGLESLGYNMFYFVDEMYGNEQFKLLAVDGVYPDRGSIARGEYILETFYYAVLRADTPADHPARELIAWMLRESAQRLFEQIGYVPLWELD